MFELVATSKELGKRRTEPIPDGKAIKIGRQTSDGISIPWDTQISREHVEINIKKNKLHVKKLADARNSVVYKGKESKKFALIEGEEFRIGRTTFALTQVDDLDFEIRNSLTTYSIKKKLGCGPCGLSYAAQHIDTGRTVVLKIMTKDQGPDSMFPNRLLSDAQSLLLLQHANLPDMIEASQSGRLIYYAREYIQGNDLASVIADKGTLSAQKSLDIVKQCVRGLQFMELNKVFHKNLKPTNIILRVGSANLVDIGLAALIGKNCSGNVEGDVNYMSPEQALSSERLDIRTDIYALGCIWYEMLTGRPPYETPDPKMTLLSHSKQPIPDPRRVNPKIPARIADIMAQMMAKSFRKRYQTTTELLQDLEQSELSGISITCDKCGKTYRVPGTAAGKRLKCRDCEAVIQVRVNL